MQSLAGNHVTVPAPELQIRNTFWHIDLNQSLVTDLILNVTTVGAAGTTGFKVYQVFVQVSCLNSANISYTCSTGSGQIALPTNMNGTSAILQVKLNTPVDPEIIEIDDLSFIFTGSPLPNVPGVIGLVSSPTPTLGPNGIATVAVTLMSIDGFGGVLTLGPASTPPGTTIKWMNGTGQTGGTVTLQAGGTGGGTLTIDASGAGPGASIMEVVILCNADCLVAPVQLYPIFLYPLRPICIPSFTLTASPTTVNLNTANPTATVTKTLTSVCGFSGNVTLSASFSATFPAFIVTFTPTSVHISPGVPATIIETISLNPASPPSPGVYTVTNTAVSGSVKQSVSVTVNVT